MRTPHRVTFFALSLLAGASPCFAQSTGGAAKVITLTASDADVRALLMGIAKEAGISIVVSTDVRHRVSLTLTNASPIEALQAIISQAGLSIATTDAPAAPVIVYYQLPVNVNQAPAEAIAARYGLSGDLSRWIVESRGARPERP